MEDDEMKISYPSVHNFNKFCLIFMLEKKMADLLQRSI